MKASAESKDRPLCLLFMFSCCNKHYLQSLKHEGLQIDKFVNFAKMRNLILAAILLIHCSSAFAQDNQKNQPSAGQVQASPDTIAIKQLDGSTLHIIGTGNIFINYTETIDGYTIVLNKVGLYEYAVSGKDGSLSPNGIIAHDPEDRLGKEKRKVKKLTKHLRLQGEALKKLEEKQQRYDATPKQRKNNNKGKKKK